MDKIAKRYLVGGVNSPVRSFKYVGGEPLLIKKGKGPFVYDNDGGKYIDYVLSWGSLILGHAHPAVIKELKQVMGSGLSFGATNAKEIELARLIHDAIPAIKKIRFVNSGTEAVMGAVRLARGFTGRDKIVKFENSYHGHADYLLAKAGSGLATFGLPSSEGVPEDFVKHTLVVPPNDAGSLAKVFKRYSDKIAAVLVEPVGGNYGVVLPDVNFLREARNLTKRYGAILVFDEVITGFRFGFGSVSKQLGITPDLICLGKIIGGGLPVGAFGGPEAIMNKLAPEGRVYQSSTFAGNPIVMTAGLATLKTLSLHKGYYGISSELVRHLAIGLEKRAKYYGIELKVAHYRNMFSFKFRTDKLFGKFYRLVLEKGVFFAPSEFEANFLSFCHTSREIENTLKAANEALKSLSEEGNDK